MNISCHSVCIFIFIYLLSVTDFCLKRIAVISYSRNGYSPASQEPVNYLIAVMAMQKGREKEQGIWNFKNKRQKKSNQV